MPASVGPQPESTKARTATPKIGTATRDVRARVYISREHGKGAHGQDTPGPAAEYFINGSIGKQARRRPHAHAHANGLL